VGKGQWPRPSPKQMAKTPSLPFRFYGLRIIWLKEGKKSSRRIHLEQRQLQLQFGNKIGDGRCGMVIVL